jgi:hypothetical protein
MRLSLFLYSNYFCQGSSPDCLSPYVCTTVLHIHLAFILKIEAEYSFEMSITIYQTTTCHIPKDNLIYSWFNEQQSQ